MANSRIEPGNTHDKPRASNSTKIKTKAHDYENMSKGYRNNLNSSQRPNLEQYEQQRKYSSIGL